MLIQQLQTFSETNSSLKDKFNTNFLKFSFKYSYHNSQE